MTKLKGNEVIYDDKKSNGIGQIPQI